MDGLDSALAYTHRSTAKHQLTHTPSPRELLPPIEGPCTLRTAEVLTRLQHLLFINGVREDYILQLGQ